MPLKFYTIDFEGKYTCIYILSLSKLISFSNFMVDFFFINRLVFTMLEAVQKRDSIDAW